MARSRSRPAGSPSSTYVYAICVLAGEVTEAALLRAARGTEFVGTRGVRLAGRRTLVVAEVPTSAFGAETPVAPRDIDWAARCAADHHAVVQQLSDRKGATVVPLRPFTLYPNDAAAKASLAAGRRALDAAFTRVTGRGEWVVRVARPLDNPVAPAGPARQATGTAFLAARSMARRSAAERDKRVRDGVGAMAAGLDGVAANVLLRPIAPSSGLVLDAACLVAHADRARFQAAIAALSRPLRAEHCRVTVTGPWPAYSFVTLTEDGRG